MISTTLLSSSKRVLTFCFLLIAPGLIEAQTASGPVQPKSSPVEEVIALVQANVPESVVIKHIKHVGKSYNLTAVDLIQLQKANVPAKLIELMMEVQDESARVPAPAAASASAAPNPGENKPKKRGFFDRVGEGFTERGKRLAEMTVSSAERTIDESAEKAEDSAGRAIDKTQADVERAVDKNAAAMERKAGVPESKPQTPSKSQKP